MRPYLKLLTTIFLVSSTFLQAETIYSPDNKLKFSILIQNNQLLYTLEKNHQLIIHPSILECTVNDLKYGVDAITLKEIAKRTENTFYTISGGHSNAHKNLIGKTFQITNSAGDSFNVEVNVFNDGVAFRYQIKAEEESVIDDCTTFTLPDKTIIWSQNNITYYEGSYHQQSVDSLKLGQLMGPPVTIQYPYKNTYVSITEANVHDFSGMALEVIAEKTLKVRLADITSKAGNFNTPWRIIMVGDLNTLVNNDFSSNLSPKPDSVLFPNGVHTEWIKPGRCVWSWLANNRSITLANMKKFTDYASELGFEYNLVDEGWSDWKEDTKDSWDLMKELVDYSATKNVKIWLWKAYPDRKGIDGIYLPEKRTAFFKKCSEIGIAGVKIDFLNGESQEICNFYPNALREAAKYHLMIDFHGANKPTGLNFTYPNEMTREGVRGLENKAPWAEQNTILPFTRYLAGPGDFTPLTFNTKRIGETTWTHQIATAIIYTSPLLCYGVSPDDLLNNPAKDFICSIPSTWDETIVLPQSELNKTVIFARRKGNTWFLAALTKNENPVMTIDLSFLQKGNYQCEMIKDVKAIQLNCQRSNTEVSSKNKLKISMNKAGGFVARFRLNTI